MSEIRVGLAQYRRAPLAGGVKATDPLTIVLVTVAVALTALLATWHPARQATRVDPKVLLRN